MRYLDFTTAFVECKVNEQLYVTLHKGVILREKYLRVGSGSHIHTRMLKSLYSLKQASLNWFETLYNSLTFIAMQKLKTDTEIYIQRRMDNQTLKAVLA